MADTQKCPKCGGTMRKEGDSMKCENCGHTSSSGGGGDSADRGNKSK